MVANSNLKMALLQEAHNGPNGGHSDVKKTLKRVKRAFYWKKLKKDVCAFVAECDGVNEIRQKTSPLLNYFNLCAF